MRRRRASRHGGALTRITVAVIVLAATLQSLGHGTAAAHTRASTGFSEIRQEGRQIGYELQLEYDVLVKVIGLGERALAAGTDPARAEALRSAHAKLAAYLRPRLRVSLDGVECEGTLSETSVQRRQQAPYATLSLSYDCPGTASGSYTILYDVFAEGGGVVDDHTSLADYALDDERGRFVFDSSHRELAVGDSSALSSALRFVALGTEHILKGLDHVLFVIALLLGARSAAGVVKVATAFTVAHSLTLAFAVVGWVDVPATVVEPLIALSIFYVAMENVVGGESRHRLAVVFGFGLLHGLGFASTLSFTDDIGWPLISSLLTFNLGVEVGQVLIIAVLFPLLLLARRFAWSSVAHAGATVAIGVLGLVWFVERLAT